MEVKNEDTPLHLSSVTFRTNGDQMFKHFISEM